jgi:hypothetical protein
MDRAEAIRHQAEAQALELIRSGLVSHDPRLAAICRKLSAFQPLLSGTSFDENKAMGLLRTGFNLVRFQPNPNAPDEEEVLRLLDGLATKLSGMGRMLLGFLK